MGQVFPAGQERKKESEERTDTNVLLSRAFARYTFTCANVVHGITDTWYAKTINVGFEPMRNKAVRNHVYLTRNMYSCLFMSS